MRKLLVISALLLALSVPGNLSAQDKAETHCIPTRNLKEKNLAFQGGEVLDYVVHYQWGAINSDVAKATITLDTLTYNGVPAFHCRAAGRTAKFYDVFFKVREDFQTWFTRDGLQPLRFKRETEEGNYVSRNEYRYVRRANEEYINADLYNTRKGYRTERLPLNSCTFDILALYFNARNLDMTKIRLNQPYPMTFAIDDDICNVTFRYYGKEVKKVKGIGKVRCMKFSFSLIEGEIFSKGQEMYCWISDDDNRIPICFEGSIKVGKVTGHVESYKGLKYPFKSLIEK